MKCVVLGGGGFIGSSVVDALLNKGHEVRVFDRPRVIPYRNFEPDEKIEWQQGDFSHSKDVARSLDGAEAVIHLVSATLPKSSNEDPVFDVQENLIATLQLLNAMKAGGVRKILFISSGGTVYGKPIRLPVDEDHPTDPLVSYGVVKLAIEKYLLAFEKLHGLSPMILRVSNPYGERQRLETAQGVVNAFLNRSLHGLPLEIWGDGGVVRDYLHVSDVADAFVKALTYEGSSRIFNISSGTGVSLNELAEMIEKISGAKVTRNYLPGRSFDVPVNILSNARAWQELKWRPESGLESGIRRTLEWMRRGG